MDFEKKLAHSRALANPSRLGLRLIRRGRNLVSPCPFHDPQENTMCFYDALGNWQYRCLRCGASGDLVDFVARTQFAGTPAEAAHSNAVAFWNGDGLNVPPEALWPRDIGGDRAKALELFARYCNWALERNEKSREWLQARGWSTGEAQVYGLGFYSGDPEPLFEYCLVEGFERNTLLTHLNYLETIHEPRITIPARNSKGMIYTVYGRRVDEDPDQRYVRFASGPSDIPFNIQPEIDCPIIVRSPWDALTADSQGVRGVVSLADSELGMAHVLKLKACGAEQFVLVLEREGRDRHELDGTVESAMALAHEAGLSFKSVVLPRGTSVQAFVRMHGGDAFLDLVRSTEPDTSRSRRRSVLLQEIRENFEDAMSHEPDSTIGWHLDRFPKLQSHLDGVQPGYYLISAHPFGGKTTLLLNLAMDLVDSNPVKVIYITLEMPRRAVFHRILAMNTGLSINDVQRRSSNDPTNQRVLKYTMDLMGMVKADRLEVWDDTQVRDDVSLRNLLREEARENRKLIVCIDGIYHLKVSGTYDGSEIHERRSQAILDIYKELDIPLFCTGELVLRKEVVDGGKAPGLVDITGPRAFVRDPMVIMFLSGTDSGLTLTLAKNRVGGRPISMNLYTDSTNARISEAPIE